jgi:hypothetical protein
MRTWLRADLLIAVCALLIGSLTCVATFFQTRVVCWLLSTGRDQQPVEVGHCSEAKEIGA